MYKKTLTVAGTVMAIIAGAMNTSATSAQEAVEFNTDRPGSDYKNFILQTPDYRICKQACGIDRNCQAWTYVKPGIQGGAAKCWLKGVIPQSGTLPSPSTRPPNAALASNR